MMLSVIMTKKRIIFNKPTERRNCGRLHYMPVACSSYMLKAVSMFLKKNEPYIF